MAGERLAVAQDSAGQFQDSFAGGKPELTWRSHAWPGHAVVEGEAVEDAPDGDGGIGVLQAAGEGPGAMSYAETVKAEDSFALGARVYCPLEGGASDGALGGLGFYIDRAGPASRTRTASTGWSATGVSAMPRSASPMSGPTSAASRSNSSAGR